jgi:hypothetical protein
LAAPAVASRLLASHTCEEATMHTALDDRHTQDRTDRLAALWEDAALLFMIFSGIVLVAALVAAFVV